MKGIYKYIIYLFITLFISTAESLTCSADNTSTYNNWKIHQSYHFPTRTEKSGNKIYVLANGGLFSYDKSDDNITIYSKKSLPFKKSITKSVYLCSNIFVKNP